MARRGQAILIVLFLLGQCLASLASEAAGLKELIEKGDEFLSEDQFDQAVASFRQAVSTAPDSAEAHQRLGKAMSLAGNLAGAEREMRRAIQLDPQDALAHSNLGMILGMQKNYYEAALEERTAIQLEPDDAFAYRTMGSALAGLGHYDQAIWAFEKAISLEPGHLNAYINLGATLGRRGDYSGAVAAYRKALNLSSRSVAAHLGLGAALGKTGDVDGQIAEYVTAVRLAPQNDNAHGRLGWAFYRKGNWQGAFREGCITNWLRLRKHGPEYLQFFLSLWAGVFLLFGLVFAVLFFGARFKPEEGEHVLKSYFLTFHKDRPGRFVITDRRIAFVPEAFSSWFGASPIKIDRVQIDTIESSTTGGGGTLTLGLKDGSSHAFTIPHLVLKPLLSALSQLTERQDEPSKPSTISREFRPPKWMQDAVVAQNIRRTGEFPIITENPSTVRPKPDEAGKKEKEES